MKTSSRMALCPSYKPRESMTFSITFIYFSIVLTIDDAKDKNLSLVTADKG